MTIRDRELFDVYRGKTSERIMIDECFDAVFEIIKSYGFVAAVDDRAENLVTEIFRYYVESNG